MSEIKVKIIALKGEKGDSGYDDTEIRALLSAETSARQTQYGYIQEYLEHIAYIEYDEDGEFELPIHTINDSETADDSTWSSEKITNDIYLKDDFLIIEGTIEAAPAQSVGVVQIQPTDYGIDSFADYAVTGFTVSSDVYWWRQITYLYSGAYYPDLRIDNTLGWIALEYYNPDTSAIDMDYKIILLKIK